jgi:beta-N-acetylhexosaminidase
LASCTGMKPVIFGLSGPVLTSDERAFFTAANPAGYILFKRNIVDRAQLHALTGDLRALAGRDDVPILIDQEGGRVLRMAPPEWPAFPPAETFDALYERAPISALEAVRVNARAIGLTLAEVGINVNIAPVLDVRRAETHAAIGERSFGHDPMRVAAMGAAMLDGLRSAGVVGVIKHMPGQGRATVDTHHHLPVIEASEADLADDLFPFERLKSAPMALTGHVVFKAWDADHPATMSATVIRDIIRGRIGFDGLLMSDDLDMAALSGDIASRAVRCLAAGCDVALNCSGTMDDMIAIAEALPEMRAESHTRLVAAMATVTPSHDFAAIPELLAKRDALLALA